VLAGCAESTIRFDEHTAFIRVAVAVSVERALLEVEVRPATFVSPAIGQSPALQHVFEDSPGGFGVPSPRPGRSRRLIGRLVGSSHVGLFVELVNPIAKDREDVHVAWDVRQIDRRPSMRSVTFNVIPFHGQTAIQLEDPGRVEHVSVDLRLVRAEVSVQQL
jgi:hypothetical protein